MKQVKTGRVRHRAAISVMLLFSTMIMLLTPGIVPGTMLKFPPGSTLSGTLNQGIATYQSTNDQKAAKQNSPSKSSANPGGQNSGDKFTPGTPPPVFAAAKTTSLSKGQAKKQPSSSSSSSVSSSSSSVSSSSSSTSSSAPSSSVSSSSASSTVSPLPPMPFPSGSRIMTGYYGGWAAYSGYTPDMINPTGINVIDYAFASIDSSLHITASDSAIDYSNFGKLLTLKSRYPSLKTIISVGGWEDSGRFSDVALTQTSRDSFSDSVVTFIKKYGFDGVDIDWEYPNGGGLSTNVTRTSDPANFVLLMQSLRAKLDAQSGLDGKRYMLTFAGAANSAYTSAISMRTLAGVVDYGFIMAYDIHGSWDKYTDFNAPLYSPSGTSPQYKSSVDSAVQAWLSSGFPAGKIVLGVPYYGHVYSGVPNLNSGLWQTYSSCKSVGFDTIRSQYLTDSSYLLTRNASALVPSLFNGSTFISYDDETSIRSKAQYAANYGMMGVGAWDISYDRSNILTNVIRSVLG